MVAAGRAGRAQRASPAASQRRHARARTALHAARKASRLPPLPQEHRWSQPVGRVERNARVPPPRSGGTRVRVPPYTLPVEHR